MSDNYVMSYNYDESIDYPNSFLQIYPDLNYPNDFYFSLDNDTIYLMTFPPDKNVPTEQEIAAANVVVQQKKDRQNKIDQALQVLSDTSIYSVRQYEKTIPIPPSICQQRDKAWTTLTTLNYFVLV